MTKPKNDARVVVSKDGPYIVSGDVPLAQQTIGADADGRFGAVDRGQVHTRRGALFAVPLRPVAHQTVLRRLAICADHFDGNETASRAALYRAGAWCSTARCWC